jgi:uncharacterized Tic20 family protein
VAPTGPERLVAALGHSAPLLGFPLLVPAGGWLLARLAGSPWAYARRQSAQALAFQAAVAGVAGLLIALSLGLGLWDFIATVVFKVVGTILLFGAGTPLALIAYMAGEPRYLNQIMGGSAADAVPGPWHWWPALTVAGLATAVLLVGMVMSVVATIQALRGRPYRYPLIGPWLDRKLPEIPE